MIQHLIFAIAILWTSSPSYGKEVLTVGTDPFCPYNCENKEKPGIVMELFRKAFKKHGYEVVFEFGSWAGAVRKLKEGITTTFGSANKNDAPELIYASVPTVYMENTFFKKKGSKWTYKGVESFTGKSLGVTANYNYEKKIDAYVEKYKADNSRVTVVSGLESLPRLFKLLDLGRIDFFLDDFFVAGHKMKAMGLQDKVEADAVVSRIPLYFGFSPKNPNAKKYAKIVSEELMLMRKNGEMRKIFDRYGLECKLCSDKSKS